MRKPSPSHMVSAIAKKPPKPGPYPGAGRPKGVKVVNVLTSDLKEIILEAAARAADGTGAEGLRDYLMQQARANPQVYLALIAKIVPPPKAEETPPEPPKVLKQLTPDQYRLIAERAQRAAAGEDAEDAVDVAARDVSTDEGAKDE